MGNNRKMSMARLSQLRMVLMVAGMSVAAVIATSMLYTIVALPLNLLFGFDPKGLYRVLISVPIEDASRVFVIVLIMKRYRLRLVTACFAVALCFSILECGKLLVYNYDFIVNSPVSMLLYMTSIPIRLSVHFMINLPETYFFIKRSFIFLIIVCLYHISVDIILNGHQVSKETFNVVFLYSQFIQFGSAIILAVITIVNEMFRPMKL